MTVILQLGIEEIKNIPSQKHAKNKSSQERQKKIVLSHFCQSQCHVSTKYFQSNYCKVFCMAERALISSLFTLSCLDVCVVYNSITPAAAFIYIRMPLPHCVCFSAQLTTVGIVKVSQLISPETNQHVLCILLHNVFSLYALGWVKLNR